MQQLFQQKIFKKLIFQNFQSLPWKEGIKRIKELQNELTEWKNLKDLIPSIFKKNTNMKKTGNAGIFAGSLELVKEGNVKLKQEKILEIFIFVTMNKQKKNNIVKNFQILK